MSDFIREVDEEYRRERAVNFLKRFQVPLVLLIVLIIAGAGGWRWYVDQRAARSADANAAYQEAEDLAHADKPAEAAARFAALAQHAPGGYKILAELAAAEQEGVVDAEAGAKKLDAIASDDKGYPALRELARYRGAMLRVDKQDPKAFVAQYGRYALDSFAFHNGMRELLALAEMKQSNFPAATKYINDLLTDPLTSPALRNRAQAYRELVAAGPVTQIASQPGPGSVKQIGGAAPASNDAGNIAPVDTSRTPAPAAPAPATPAPATPKPAPTPPAH